VVFCIFYVAATRGYMNMHEHVHPSLCHASPDFSFIYSLHIDNL